MHNYGQDIVIHNYGSSSQTQEPQKRLCPGCEERVLNPWYLKTLCSACKEACVQRAAFAAAIAAATTGAAAADDAAPNGEGHGVVAGAAPNGGGGHGDAAAPAPASE